MTAVEAWKQRARQLKTETYALYLAYKDPRTPWYARLFAALVVGYAFSPIDLVPDFIPVLGYLDDLIGSHKSHTDNQSDYGEGMVPIPGANALLGIKV